MILHLFCICCIVLYLLTYSQLYTHLIPAREFMHMCLCMCVTTCHHLATLYLCLRSTLPLSLLCLCLDSYPATSPYTLMQWDYPSDDNGHHVFHHTNLLQHNRRPNTKPKQKNKKGLTHMSTATRFSYSAEDLAPSCPHVIASFVTYSTDG